MESWWAVALLACAIGVVGWSWPSAAEAGVTRADGTSSDVAAHLASSPRGDLWLAQARDEGSRPGVTRREAPERASREAAGSRQVTGDGPERRARAAERERQDEEAALSWAWLMRDDSHAESMIDQVFGDSGQWMVDSSLLGNPLWRWFAALASLIAMLAFRRWALAVVYRSLHQAALRTSTQLDNLLLEAIRPSVFWFVALLGVAFGAMWLEIAPHLREAGTVLLRMAFVLLVARALYRATWVFGTLMEELSDSRRVGLSSEVSSLIPRVMRVIIWILAVIFIVQELGYEVGGLLAGLGVGGLAFALAARDTLSNWFGALMIFTDRPFAVGDWVKTSSLEGTVEEIGLRSTKVRTFARTVVSIPNSVLAHDVVENFSRMPVRRVFYTLGITYRTTPAMMEEGLERIRDVLRTHPGVDQTFHMVRFTDFGESSLDIMVYYFTNSTIWDEYLDVREQINLRIMHELEGIGVSVAFPTRSIYMEERLEGEREKLDVQAKKLLKGRERVDERTESRRGNEAEG